MPTHREPGLGQEELSVPGSDSGGCRVTGRFTQRFHAGGSFSCNIPQSTLSKDNEVVTGVGQCDGGSAIFSFNMVKR